jgi:hypothetical protein
MERNLHLQQLLDDFKGTVSQSNGAIFSQSKELVRGPPELVQHFRL